MIRAQLTPSPPTEQVFAQVLANLDQQQQRHCHAYPVRLVRAHLPRQGRHSPFLASLLASLTFPASVASTVGVGGSDDGRDARGDQDGSRKRGSVDQGDEDDGGFWTGGYGSPMGAGGMGRRAARQGGLSFFWSPFRTNGLLTEKTARNSSLAWTLSSANPSPIAIPRRRTLRTSSALRLESPTSSVRAQIWRRQRCCISTSRWRLASREWCRWIGNG